MVSRTSTEACKDMICDWSRIGQVKFDFIGAFYRSIYVIPNMKRIKRIKRYEYPDCGEL